MRTTEPSPPHRLPLCALVALALLAGWGGCRKGAEAPPAPVERSGFELEPILWARSEVPYEDFRSEPLRALYAELTTELGEPLLFRVVPYVEQVAGQNAERDAEQDPEAGPWVLVGETLEVYYQESRASVNTLRRKADRVVRSVQSAFPGLDDNDHVLIHARLPEGKIVADLDRGLNDACGSRNAVRTDVRPSSYVPGTLEELNFVLCDGPAQLDVRLQDPEWPLIEENWRTRDGGP